MTATMECPRRMERYSLFLYTMKPWQLAEYIEHALTGESHPVLNDDGKPIPVEDEWRSDGTCSYCGSMSPEALFKAIEDGQEIGPTDKAYKVYVDHHRGKFYLHHLNRENAALLKTMIEGGTVKIGYPGYFYNGLWLARPEKPADEG